MSEAPLLFLDANALASPVTRTLLIAGARADGLRWTWSRHVEVEADRHARGQASRTSIVRKTILGTELSPTAQSTEGLATDSAQDRQVVADAIHAGARYLITTDVDDFAFDDLAAHGRTGRTHLIGDTQAMETQGSGQLGEASYLRLRLSNAGLVPSRTLSANFATSRNVTVSMTS